MPQGNIKVEQAVKATFLIENRVPGVEGLTKGKDPDRRVLQIMRFDREGNLARLTYRRLPQERTVSK